MTNDSGGPAAGVSWRDYVDQRLKSIEENMPTKADIQLRLSDLEVKQARWEGKAAIVGGIAGAATAAILVKILL